MNTINYEQLINQISEMGQEFISDCIDEDYDVMHNETATEAMKTMLARVLLFLGEKKIAAESLTIGEVDSIKVGKSLLYPESQIEKDAEQL